SVVRALREGSSSGPALPKSTPITGPLSGPPASALPASSPTASRLATDPDQPTNTLIESGPTPADEAAVAATLREGRPRDPVAHAPPPPAASPAAPPAAGGSVPDVPTDWVFKAAPVAGVPERIGPYRILKKIGSGGFGLVLEATREDSFQKRVAIKLLQRGAASEETLKRFERERQVMAAMNHPNIARLLEGGKTDDGRPWFAMEYVEGLAIDDYCDRNRLSVHERVAMFVKVCSAMHTVHKAQVVHRDLKPANILVNTKGEPKLLDFGIAKMIEPEWGATPMVTRERRGPLTPQYASPEQVRGEPVTTSTDVYSLGVLLYELLTGRLPYRLEGMSDHELEAKVCHALPPRPSAMVVREPSAAPSDHSPTQTGGGGGGADPAQTGPAPKRTWSRTRAAHSSECLQLADRRAATPEELRRQLGDDLDDIVMMALRKEPMRRYESAMEMGDDLKRHIDRMPVKARPETISYVARRFVGRHRGAVASALTMSLLIVSGLVLMTVLWFQAERARAKERESREQTLKLLSNFMFTVRAIRGDQDGSVSEKAVAEAAAPVLEATKSIPAGDVEQRAAIARVLEAIASAASGANVGSVSMPQTARPIIDRALELRREVLALRPADGLAIAGLAQCANQAGPIYRELGLNEPALKLFIEAEKLAAAGPPDSVECKRARAVALVHRSDLAALEEKEQLLNESIKVRRELVTGPGARPQDSADLALSCFKLAELRARDNDIPSAIRMHKQALEARKSVAGAAPTWQARYDLIRSYVQLGNLSSRGAGPDEPMDQDNFNFAAECFSQATDHAAEVAKEIGTRTLPDRVRQALMNAYTSEAILLSKIEKFDEASISVESAWRIATSVQAKTRNDAATFQDLADIAFAVAGKCSDQTQGIGLIKKSKDIYDLLKLNGQRLDSKALENYQRAAEFLDSSSK
ncbi:MAG: protein kinase domain-containing protein, partial [Phycisphaerales bacterium]